MSYSEAAAHGYTTFLDSSPIHTRNEASAKNSFVTPSQERELDRQVRFSISVRSAVAEADEAFAMPAASALKNVARFIRLLPDCLPVTDAYISSSGSVSFDWDDDQTWQLSLALQSGSRIAFAAYFAGDKVHGSASFSAEKLPDELVAAIKRWASFKAK